MSALIPVEQRQATLPGGENLEGVGKFKYLGLIFVVSSQGTEEILPIPHSLVYKEVGGL